MQGMGYDLIRTTHCSQKGDGKCYLSQALVAMTSNGKNTCLCPSLLCLIVILEKTNEL